MVLGGMVSLPLLSLLFNPTMILIFSTLLVALIMVLFTKNSSYYLNKKMTIKHMLLVAVVFAYAISKSLGSSSEVFLYYNF
jgi:hypothetical protein